MKLTEIPYQGQVFRTLSFNEQHGGVPIILVHGLLCSVYSWYPRQLEFFFEFGPVHSVALPAHAPSTAPADWQRVDESTLLSALEVQIQQLAGNCPVVLIGHSTGGNAALVYALAHPERVLGVITIGTAHTGREEGGVYGLLQWANVRAAVLGRAMVRALLWLNALSPRLHKQFLKDITADPQAFLRHPDLDAYVASYFHLQKKLDARAMIAYFRDLGAMDHAAGLRGLRLPVLVMCGDKDPYVSRARTNKLLDCLPQGQLCWIENSGHVPMFEQPQQYESAVRRFLWEVTG